MIDVNVQSDPSLTVSYYGKTTTITPDTHPRLGYALKGLDAGTVLGGLVGRPYGAVNGGAYMFAATHGDPAAQVLGTGAGLVGGWIVGKYAGSISGGISGAVVGGIGGTLYHTGSNLLGSDTETADPEAVEDEFSELLDETE